MTDPEAIDRRLAAARSASWAPADAQARIRANLAASGVQGGSPGVPSARAVAARTGSVTKLTAAVLVGVGFVAGYWLGAQRAGDALIGATATAGAAAERAPSEALPSLPSAASASASAASASAASASEASASEASASEDSPSGTPSEREQGSTRAAAAPGQRPEGSHAPPSVPGPRATARAATPMGRAVLSRPPTYDPDPFAEELSLLQRAERAIRSGEAPLAMSFLDELDRRFPHTTLSEERSAARVLAGCALSSPDARLRAELFLRDREASVYSDRVRRSCGLELSTPAAREADGSEAPGH